MEKVKVIFRKDKQCGDVIAFLPELTANRGNILCYQHIGQHGEACLEYYWSTEKASENEYADLLKELAEIYDDCELVVRQRLCYNDLTNKAWKVVDSLDKFFNALSES